MEFTPSPTVEALQQSAKKDDIFIAGFGAGMNIVSTRGIPLSHGNITKYVGLLTQEYIATATK